MVMGAGTRAFAFLARGALVTGRHDLLAHQHQLKAVQQRLEGNLLLQEGAHLVVVADGHPVGVALIAEADDHHAGKIVRQESKLVGRFLDLACEVHQHDRRHRVLGNGRRQLAMVADAAGDFIAIFAEERVEALAKELIGADQADGDRIHENTPCTPHFEVSCRGEACLSQQLPASSSGGTLLNDRKRGDSD